MTLKRQLLLSGLLMLLIPWLGIQFVLDLDQALREQARQQLALSAEKTARLMATALDALPPATQSDNVIYAHALNRQPQLDGFDWDWPDFEEPVSEQGWTNATWKTQETSGGIQWRAAATSDHLYVLIRLSGREAAIFDNTQPDKEWDRIWLSIHSPGETLSRWVRSTGQGPLISLSNTMARDYRIKGFWEPIGNGIRQLELELPRPVPGTSLRLQLTGPDENGTRVRLFDSGELPVLSRLPIVERSLAAFLEPGQQAQILEKGQTIAEAELAPVKASIDVDQLSMTELLEQIALNGLRWIIRSSHSENSITTSVDLPDGRALKFSESLDPVLSLSSNALGTVIARSSLLLVFIMLALLTYASWLSWRITRLRKAVSATIDDDGRVLKTLKPSKAQDELGELSRHFALLTERLQGYTDYLETFSRRLSHELKTPVAVVRSSLENLENLPPAESQPDEHASYVTRARHATDRLTRILHSMSEAARLEQSLEETEHEIFDLADVLGQATQAYQTLDEAHTIGYQGPPEGLTMRGSPELLVQLLDKLVDNARDFTPAGGRIVVSAAAGERHSLQFSVFNEGPPLPDTLSQDIFSPFISVRTGNTDGHLGQGLLIARLIAEHHRGRIAAENVEGGVRFTVTLNRSLD